MEKLNKKDFTAKKKTWIGAIEYVQELIDFERGIYRVVATLYTITTLGARIPKYYSSYKETI